MGYIYLDFFFLPRWAAKERDIWLLSNPPQLLRKFQKPWCSNLSETESNNRMSSSETSQWSLSHALKRAISLKISRNLWMLTSQRTQCSLPAPTISIPPLFCPESSRGCYCLVNISPAFQKSLQAPGRQNKLL